MTDSPAASDADNSLAGEVEHHVEVVAPRIIPDCHFAAQLNHFIAFSDHIQSLFF